MFSILGRCDPADLVDETKEQLPVKVPPRARQPPHQDPHSVPVWEGRPPRGDVPNPGHFLGSEGGAQDQPHDGQDGRLQVHRNSHRVSLTEPAVLCQSVSISQSANTSTVTAALEGHY